MSSKLVNGLIPAGMSCPFLDNCKFKIHHCPGVDGKVKSNTYSCAAARMHDMIENNKADHIKLKVLVRKIPEHTADTNIAVVMNDDSNSD